MIGLRCPCGSGDTYVDCCGRLHHGSGTAATAEALMRSRFSAFAVGEPDYLLETWHPRTRPARVDLDPATRWTRLEIIAAAGGPFDVDGVVEFRAHYRVDGAPGELHERSRFVRADSRWLYVDGIIDP